MAKRKMYEYRWLADNGGVIEWFGNYYSLREAMEEYPLLDDYLVWHLTRREVGMWKSARVRKEKR